MQFTYTLSFDYTDLGVHMSFICFAGHIYPIKWNNLWPTSNLRPIFIACISIFLFYKFLWPKTLCQGKIYANQLFAAITMRKGHISAIVEHLCINRMTLTMCHNFRPIEILHVEPNSNITDSYLLQGQTISSIAYPPP